MTALDERPDAPLATSLREPRLLIFAPAARRGGPLRYVAEALPTLGRLWPGRVTVAIPSETVEHLPDLPPTVEIVVLDQERERRGSLRRVLHTQMVAYRLLRTTRADVTFCLGNVAYFGPRVPTVTLIQNAARTRHLRSSAGKYQLYFLGLSALIRVSALRSSRLICASQYTRSLVPSSRHIPMDVVYHGMKETLERSSAERSDHDLLVPGQILPYKGIEDALDVLTRLQSTYRLRLAGGVADERYADFCRRRAEQLGVLARVDWLGPLSHERLLEEMTTCRAVLFPTRAEACPNVLLEAAAVDPRRPIIALRHRWNVEYADLLDARCRVDEVPAALDQGKFSPGSVAVRRSAALKSFTWQRSMKQTVEVLLEVAASRQGRRSR